MAETCRPWIGVNGIPGVKGGVLLYLYGFLEKEKNSSPSFWPPSLEVQ